MALTDEPDFGQTLSDEELLDWAYKCLERSKDWFAPVHEDARKMWDMRAGKSFTPAERQFLKETQRPAIDPPFAAGILDTVKGAEMGQQTEPVFHGADESVEDEVIGSWLTNLTRIGFGKVAAHRKLHDAYDDMLVGGYGFMIGYMDVRNVPIRPTLKSLNYWCVWPDPDAVEQNLEDANFFLVGSKWRLEDAVANWPAKEDDLRNAWSSVTGGKLANIPRAPRTGLRSGGLSARQGVEIFEFHYRRGEKMAVWADPETGKQRKTTRAEYDKTKKQLDDAVKAAEKEYRSALEMWSEVSIGSPSAAGPEPLPPPEMPTLRDEEAYFFNGHRYYRAYVAGAGLKEGVLLENRALDCDEFLVKAITGFPWKQGDQERVRFYGLMAKIADLQMFFSRTIQGYLEVMARKIKGGGFYEKGAFGTIADQNKFIKNSSIPGMWHGVEDGALQQGKIRENPSISGEPGLQELYRTLVEMFGLISGVTQALQGTLQADRSNVLVSNLQEQGLQMLLPIRAPRTALVMAVGRLYAKLATKYLPAEEIDKIIGKQDIPGMTFEMVPDPVTGEPTQQPIIGEDGEPVTAGKILKGKEVMDYEVTVDVGVATPTQRQATWQFFSQHGLLQTMLEAGMPPQIILPTLLRNSPLPGTVSKDLGDRLESFYGQQEQAQTEEGMVQGFTAMLQKDPQAAEAVLQQMAQMLQGGASPGAEQVQ